MDNDVIEVFSVFDFEDQMRLFCFLHEQHSAGKTVHFQNEGLTIPPTRSTADDAILICYMAVKSCPEIAKHYIDWLVAKNNLLAQVEKENIKNRMSVGRAQKAKRGGYSGGRAPMGYKVENGQLVINEEEAPAVRFIFEHKFAGDTMLGTVNALNEAGYTTRNGKPFVISTVQSIWNNEKTYRGYYRYGKDGEWVEGQHEPILTE